MTVHDARRTCATLLVDVEVRPRVIMRIRRDADVSMTLEIYSNASPMATREAQRRLGGAPFDAQVNSRCCCCTCRILLLYWQQERPSPTLVRASDLREYSRGDRI